MNPGKFKRPAPPPVEVTSPPSSRIHVPSHEELAEQATLQERMTHAIADYEAATEAMQRATAEMERTARRMDDLETATAPLLERSDVSSSEGRGARA